MSTVGGNGAALMARLPPDQVPSWRRAVWRVGASLVLTGCFTITTIPTTALPTLNGLGDPQSDQGGQQRVVEDIDGDPWTLEPGDELTLCSSVLAAQPNRDWTFDAHRKLEAPSEAYVVHPPCGLTARLDAVRFEDGNFVGRRLGYRVVDVPLAVIDHAELEHFSPGKTLLAVGVVLAAEAALIGLILLTDGPHIRMGSVQMGP